MALIPTSLIFLIIEFFDELAYSADGAAKPLMRSDIGLSYVQIGMLFGVPAIVNFFIEPVIMLLGDTSYRKHLVAVGGLVMSLSLAAIATAQSFPVMLLAFIICFPASGAFVSLSQATLLNWHPGKETHWMARWTVAGAIGTLIGPLLLVGGLALGSSWREVFLSLAVLGLLLTLATIAVPAHTHYPSHTTPEKREHPHLGNILRGLQEALRNRQLLRWIVLLQFSDLMLDVFAGYVPLYLVDVAGLPPSQASLAFSLFMLCTLAADLSLIPLLKRFTGRKIVRYSAALVMVLFTSWLLLPGATSKVVLVLAIRLATIGWYQVLQGEAFASTPGRSGTVMAIGSMMGSIGGAMAWTIGWVANQVGLPSAMWLLLLGPLTILFFLPGRQKLIA